MNVWVSIKVVGEAFSVRIEIRVRVRVRDRVRVKGNKKVEELVSHLLERLGSM